MIVHADALAVANARRVPSTIFRTDEMTEDEVRTAIARLTGLESIEVRDARDLHILGSNVAALAAHYGTLPAWTPERLVAHQAHAGRLTPDEAWMTRIDCASASVWRPWRVLPPSVRSSASISTV